MKAGLGCEKWRADDLSSELEYLKNYVQYKDELIVEASMRVAVVEEGLCMDSKQLEDYSLSLLRATEERLKYFHGHVCKGL